MKKAIKDLITTHKESISKDIRRIEVIRADTGTTEERKAELIDGVLAGCKRRDDVAAEIMMDYLNAVQPSKSEPTDRGQLSATLEAIKAGGDHLTREDIQTLIEPFAGDFTAMNVLKGAVSGRKDALGLSFPQDTRDRAQTMIERMKERWADDLRTEKYAGRDAIYTPELVLGGMAQTLDQYFDSDMGYVAPDMAAEAGES